MRENYANLNSPRDEYGLMLDCVHEGCVPFHIGHGDIFDVGPNPPEEDTLNGHAAAIVRRTVYTSSWNVVGWSNKEDQ